MPADEPEDYEKALAKVVQLIGTYPPEAYYFVQAGLSFTVNRTHGDKVEEGVSRHITGQQLCEGIRDYARAQWGLLAQTVLARWNITCTFDFGRIVFAMVDNELMQKTEKDSIEDFRNVYDFKSAFDADYRIEIKA